MAEAVVVMVVVISAILYGRIVVNRLGIGGKSGGSDCGCGSGNRCKTKEVKR